jgi:hypothetical protein
MTQGVANTFGIKSNDRLYITMPMYHSAAGILGIFQPILGTIFAIFSGIGQLYTQGCAAVVRRKFSASRFWDDCIKYECTVGSANVLHTVPHMNRSADYTIHRRSVSVSLGSAAQVDRSRPSRVADIRQWTPATDLATSGREVRYQTCGRILWQHGGEQ